MLRFLALLVSFTFVAFRTLRGFGGLRPGFFQHREVDFLFDGIDPIDDHPQAVADAVDLAGVLSDDLARVFVVGVAVVDERVQRDESFDEKVGEFDEESELGDAGDETVEVFSDAVLHELDLLPFHEFAFGVVGTAFGLAGLFGDFVELFERDRSGERRVRFAMRGMIAALGPGGRRLHRG